MSVILRGDWWHYVFEVGGKRYRGSTGIRKTDPAVDGKSPKKRAEEKEESIRVQIREGHSIQMIWEQTKRKMIASSELGVSFEEIWNAFEKKNISQASPRRRQLYIGHIRGFCDWIKKNHSEIQSLSMVTEDIAKEYVSLLFSQPGAPATKNDKLTTLRMLFNVLGKSVGIIDNPFKSEEIRKQKKIQVDREIWRAGELDLILKSSRGLWDDDDPRAWIYTLCLAGLNCGQREGDIATLKKSYFDLREKWIHIPHTGKTGKPFDFPLFPELEKHVLECMKLYPESEFVFPHLADKYQKDAAGIGGELKIFFEEIGIVGTHTERTGYARKVSVKDAHSFRHTCIYLAAISDIPYPVVSAAFHDSPVVTRIYTNHVSRKEKEQYFRKIPYFFRAPEKSRIDQKRIINLLNKISAENFDRNKKRLIAILSK